MEFDERIQTSIIRLFSGEATAEEKHLIHEWVNQSPENKKMYDELKDIWLAAGTLHNSDQYPLEREIRKFKEMVRQKEISRKRNLIILSTLKYAAVFLLVAAIPFSYYFGKQKKSADVTWSTVTCQLGDKSMILLPDSSRVWLNSGSKLTFNNNFTEGNRELQLEGEAYFAVVKDPQNPFTVTCGPLSVQVLGTEFNLKAYPDENHISTTLIEGSVEVIGQRNKVLLTPGQKLVYNPQNNKMTLYELSDTAPETEWKEGRLVFRNESLRELELKLERWFDVDIALADEMVKEKRYTGILERESILEVMSYFSLAKSVGYRIDGNKVTFYTTEKNKKTN